MIVLRNISSYHKYHAGKEDRVGCGEKLTGSVVMQRLRDGVQWTSRQSKKAVRDAICWGSDGAEYAFAAISKIGIKSFGG